jgi:hypothetical protein
LKVSSVCIFVLICISFAAFGSEAWVFRNFGYTACFFVFFPLFLPLKTETSLQRKATRLPSKLTSRTDQQSNQAAVAPVITAASPTSGDAADPGIEMVNRLFETAIC